MPGSLDRPAVADSGELVRRYPHAFAAVIPPILPDGRMAVWRYLGRFNALPQGTSEVQGQLIAPAYYGRVAMIVQNVGNGPAFVSHDPILTVTAGHRIGAGETFRLDYPQAASNALYAVTDATGGADLRVSHVIYDRPEAWLAEGDPGEVG